MTDIDKQLDEIIIKLYLGDKFWGQYHNNPAVIAINMTDHKPAKAKAALKRLVREAQLQQANDDWYALTKATPQEHRKLLRERIKELEGEA